MPTIEYFYASYSAFAYLGHRRLFEIAEAAGATVVHKPFDLPLALMTTTGGGFRKYSDAHKKYHFKREIDRWAEYRNAPVQGFRPTHHDNPIDISNGMLIAGLQQGVDIGPLAHRMLEGHWRDDADLCDLKTLTAAARDAGYDLAPFVEAAHSDAVKAIYERNTVEAIERSVFGSPTYFVGGDMFYGQDHLEMVERALVSPYAGTWPPPAEG